MNFIGSIVLMNIIFFYLSVVCSLFKRRQLTAELLASGREHWGPNQPESILGSSHLRIKSSHLVCKFSAGLHSSIFTCGNLGEIFSLHIFNFFQKFTFFTFRNQNGTALGEAMSSNIFTLSLWPKECGE
mgnify:CR=1 FL=1